MKSYDSISYLMQTILDVPMYEGVGTLAHDIARPPTAPPGLDHTMTLIGASIAWVQLPLSNLTYIHFTPVTDYLQLLAAASTDMNFTTGPFSLAAWIYLESIATDKFIIERGLAATDGWIFAVNSTGQIYVLTNQAGFSQVSTTAAGAITISGWWFVGATRLAGSVRLYRNGVDVTSVANVHTDPTGNAARNLQVGADNALVSTWDGYISRPMVFGRQISPLEMYKLFESSRDFYGI